MVGDHDARYYRVAKFTGTGQSSRVIPGLLHARGTRLEGSTIWTRESQSRALSNHANQNGRSPSHHPRGTDDNADHRLLRETTLMRTMVSKRFCSSDWRSPWPRLERRRRSILRMKSRESWRRFMAEHGGTGLNSVRLSGNVLTSNGSTWISAAPSGAFDARSRLHLYDEFCGGNQSSGQIGELGWLTNGGGGS